jgi:phenylpropionate dioxygenase-like ring-hydroxylating dioxygenase large terminal subunit
VFVNPGRLPFQLPTAAYSSLEWHSLERERLFAPRWHFACVADELPRPGSFVTRELSGAPIILWNVDGEPRAFLNVCAHRHAMVTCAPSGCAAELRCQYHGWGYDGRGYATRIPDGPSFAPLHPKEHRLQPLRLEG